MMLQLFRKPVFSDPEQTRQARVLRALLLVTMVAFSAGPALLLLVMPGSAARWLSVFVAINVPVVGSLWLNRRGRVRLASSALIVIMSMAALGFSLTAGGVRAPGILGGYIVIVLFAGVLLGARASILTAVLLGIAGLGLVYLELAGLLPPIAVTYTAFSWWLVTMVFVGLAIGVMRLAVKSIRSALHRAHVELDERTRAERALRESEARYRTLSEASFEGIALSERGIIVDTNDQLADMLGSTRAQLVGKQAMDFVAPESRDTVRKAIAAGVPGPYQHLAQRADGTVFPVEIQAGRMTLGGHEMRVTVIRDMTFRKEAEAALRESAERLRTLGDNLPEGAVYQLVREHDGSIRCVYVSAGVERVTGLKPEALLQDSSLLPGAVLAEDRARWAAQRETSSRDLTVFDLEVRIPAVSGELRWVLVRSAPRRLPDGRTIWDGFLMDITERKQAEEEHIRLEARLREAQKTQALGLVAGGVAHDLNNILTAIKGNTKLAIEGLTASDPAHRSLEEIDRACERAIDVVRRILTFSRHHDPVRRALAIQPIVEEALGLLRATLPPMIEIGTKFSPGLPMVMTDATQIHQIVMNLGTNAVQAIGRRSGRLDVRVTAVTVDTALARTSSDLREGPYVCLAITDTGCGMDRATMERIFEPFFTTKPPGVGTGLGLAVVHDIVGSHGGAITVESEAGKGSTFRVYLPAGASVAAEPRVAMLPIARGHGERVLYVDDEEALVFLATRMLERLGYRVSGFTDAAQALDAFRANSDNFDVVVTDLGMPGMPGSELARKLLEIRPDLPIIMTSGYIRSKDQEMARRLGVRELIMKPNTVDELAEVLNQVFVEVHNSPIP